MAESKRIYRELIGAYPVIANRCFFGHEPTGGIPVTFELGGRKGKAGRVIEGMGLTGGLRDAKTARWGLHAVRQTSSRSVPMRFPGLPPAALPPRSRRPRCAPRWAHWQVGRSVL